MNRRERHAAGDGEHRRLAMAPLADAVMIAVPTDTAVT